MKTATQTIAPRGSSHDIRVCPETAQVMPTTPNLKPEARITGEGRLELRAKGRRRNLAAKLKAFDPAVHAGELMVYVPIGAELNDMVHLVGT